MKRLIYNSIMEKLASFQVYEDVTDEWCEKVLDDIKDKIIFMGCWLWMKGETRATRVISSNSVYDTIYVEDPDVYNQYQVKKFKHSDIKENIGRNVTLQRILSLLAIRKKKEIEELGMNITYEIEDKINKEYNLMYLELINRSDDSRDFLQSSGISSNGKDFSDFCILIHLLELKNYVRKDWQAMNPNTNDGLIELKNRTNLKVV